MMMTSQQDNVDDEVAIQMIVTIMKTAVVTSHEGCLADATTGILAIVDLPQQILLR
jgi:hypothetical protein